MKTPEQRISQLEDALAKQQAQLNLLSRRILMMEKDNVRNKKNIRSAALAAAERK